MDREVICVVCGGQARRYLVQDYCDDCHPNLPPQPDPYFTLDAFRARKKPFKSYHKYGTSHEVVKKSKWVK